MAEEEIISWNPMDVPVDMLRNLPAEIATYHSLDPQYLNPSFLRLSSDDDEEEDDDARKTNRTVSPYDDDILWKWNPQTFRETELLLYIEKLQTALGTARRKIKRLTKEKKQLAKTVSLHQSSYGRNSTNSRSTGSTNTGSTAESNSLGPLRNSTERLRQAMASSDTLEPKPKTPFQRPSGPPLALASYGARIQRPSPSLQRNQPAPPPNSIWRNGTTPRSLPASPQFHRLAVAIAGDRKAGVTQAQYESPGNRRRGGVWSPKKQSPCPPAADFTDRLEQLSNIVARLQRQAS